MKKVFWVLLCLCLLIVVYSTNSLAEFNVGARVVSFDWTNPAQFVDWNGEPLPNPWLAENHYGIDLTTSNRCPVSDGWNLYFKRMTPADQGIFVNSIRTANSNISYFALYNKYTGVLRLFTFIKGDNYNGEDTFSLTLSVVDGSNNVKNPGLFLNDGQDTIATNLTDKSTLYNKDRVTVMEAYYNKWIVVDYFMSYDPTLATSNFSNLYFNIDIRARNQMNVQMSGNFKFSLKDVLKTKKSFISSLIDSALNVGGQVSKRISSVEDLVSEIDEDGNKLIENSLIDVGLTLKHASMAINPLTGYIGAGLGVYDIISGFTNITGGSKQTHLMYGKGSIKLDGTITDDFPKGFLKMGVAGAQFNELYDAPKYTGKLGLFSLKRKPVIEIHRQRNTVTVYDYWNRPVGSYNSDRLGWNPYDNFFAIVEINPETNMELVQVRIAPILKVACDSYTASYNFNSDYFTVQKTSPFTFNYKEMVNPQDFYDAQLRDEWVCGDTDTWGGSDVSISKAYYKIYMLFQNRTNPNIKVEVMRTYEAFVDLQLDQMYDFIQE